MRHLIHCGLASLLLVTSGTLSFASTQPMAVRQSGQRLTGWRMPSATLSTSLEKRATKAQTDRQARRRKLTDHEALAAILRSA